MKTLIPSQNLEKLNNKMERLARVAKRLKVEGFDIVVGGVEIYPPVFDGMGFMVKPASKLYEVEALGVSPKLEGGFTFVATLEHTPAGNQIRALPTNTVAIPESFRTVKSQCDHCNLTRNRKDTYLVVSETGEFKQVGHQCVANYLGHRSLEMIIACAKFVEELESLEDEEGGRGGYASFGVCTSEYLAMACEVVAREGFRSRKSAEIHGGATTSQLAMLHLDPPASKLSKGFKPYKIHKDSYDMAQAVIAFTQSMEVKSDYDWNLKVACSKESLERRDLGVVASAVSAYQRHLGIQVEQQKARTESAHFGAIGQRLDVTLTVTKQIAFDTMYGSSFMYLFRDENGNVVKWTTTSGGLDIGTTYAIKGTVKEHAEYKGIKQTVLTRCKVLKSVK